MGDDLNTELMLHEPLVRAFTIEGLYGYRTVSMSASHGATILIAKNGSGKTTLLGALDAFLNGHFARLGNIDFQRIVCLVAGYDAPLVLESSDVESLMTVPENLEFLSLARRADLDPAQMLDFIEGGYDSDLSYSDLEEDESFKKILSAYRYNFADAKKACDKLIDVMRGRVPAVDHIRSVLKSCLNGVEVIYLPTYRRIELSLAEPSDDPRMGRKRPSVQSRLGLSKKSLFNTEIQFGLRDISERLAQLNSRMLFDSNQGYREISANIINDLLDGTFEREVPELGSRPDKDSLALFFSRIKQNPRFPGHFDTVQVPDIDKIYNEGASSVTSNKFLNYFLGNLNSVILSTRAIEGLVEDFVDHCNAYLSASDPSVEVGGGGSGEGADDKVLRIDRLTLQVSVFSKVAEKAISMDSLSSGEKQMVSLFAKLFLYDGPKIVLIDEPELSLSIDWQRKILLDVVRAPTCSQLIAITHSPFVFDNQLEPYARALSLKILPAAPSQSQVGLEEGGAYV